MSEGREHPHRTNCAACCLPPQENHCKRKKLKEQKGNTASLPICSVGNNRGHPNAPVGKITCIHPGRHLNSLGLVMSWNTNTVLDLYKDRSCPILQPVHSLELNHILTTALPDTSASDARPSLQKREPWLRPRLSRQHFVFRS